MSRRQSLNEYRSAAEGELSLVRSLAWDLSVWSLYALPVSAWILSRYSGLLPHAKECYGFSLVTGYSKLPVGRDYPNHDL